MTVSIPVLNSVGDVYELHWVEEGIYITLDHVSEGENMNGEFHVELNGTGNKRAHVYQAKMNLLSISAKKSLAEATGPLSALFFLIVRCWESPSL